MNTTRNLPASLTGLVVALVIPALLVAAPAPIFPFQFGPITGALLNEAIVGALALAVLAIVRFWERRPLASIGLGPPRWSAIGFGALVVIGLVLLALLAALAVKESGMEMPEDPVQLVLGLPIWVQMIVAVSAGFTEEILFRGYAIERVTELTRSRWLGALVPILVFGGIHAPFWGLAHAIVAGLSGLWLTLIYLWRRNLWTNITAHILLDGMTLLAADYAQQNAMN